MTRLYLMTGPTLHVPLIKIPALKAFGDAQEISIDNQR